MEEILASIRRIISQDDEQPAAPAVNGHDGKEEEDDALVLTDMVVGENSVVELKEEPAAEPIPVKVEAPVAPPEPAVEPEAVMPQSEAVESLPDIELDEPAQPARADPPVAPADIDVPMDSELISPDVAAASAATMAQLMARKPHTTQTSATSLDGLLVETLVRRAIEPMLKDWLDENLQEIVERLVRREVERLSRKAELS